MSLEPVYGQPPIIGFTVSVEDLRLDFELYHTLYQASNNGKTMSKSQIERYKQLKALFMPDDKV